jgi:gluconolactonase
MNRLRLIVSLGTLLAASQWAAGQFLPPGSTPTRLVTGYSFTEGPVYDGAGGVYFTNLVFANQAASDIIRYDIASGMAQVVDPNSGGANGLFRDANGHLVSADQQRHQISRRSAANVATVEEVLADEWNGQNFNSPNDLVIDRHGGIYFSDPNYSGMPGVPEAVYYGDPQGTVERLLTGFNRPNGVILSPGGGTFYLAVEGAGERRIMAYDVGPNGALSNQREFARTNVTINGTPINVTNGPDGLTVDAAGNVYAAVQNAVFAWNPAGQRLFDLPMPAIPTVQDPTNVTFGGPDGRTLFITAGNSLYGIELNVPSPQTGDYNGDGTVDAADYTTWRDTLGSTENLSADGNGNRVIDAGDFGAWVSQFGNELGGAASASVQTAPEPSAIWLLAAAGAALTSGFARRHS